VFATLRTFFQTADEAAKRAFDNVRGLRQSNEKFQARVIELQKAREKMNSEQDAVVAVAVEKAKSEIITSGASVNNEELLKKHAQELETLRAQLIAQHEAALKTAVDAATAAAKGEATVTSSDESTKAAVTAAISARDAELRTRHAAELEAAVESGRREQATKGKLKDAQLVRAQSKLKDLEAQIIEWRKAGLIPEAATATATPAASTSKAPAPVTATPSTSQPVAAPTSSVVPATVSAKPAPSAPASLLATAIGEKPPTSGAVPLGVPGRGRGRAAPRGAARGLHVRGAAPGRGGAPSPVATTSATAGVSIFGAASKRGREEEAADDALSKRLKPTTTETTGTVKPPVTLRRPPPPS
jgi:nucleoprotein TPR